MPGSRHILVFDIGAFAVKAAEFSSINGVLHLESFDYQAYTEEMTDESRTMLVSSAVKDILARNKFNSSTANICLSGQFAFSNFVKLPPVSGDKGRIQQIVEYEAQQNVPFPMEEVTWDYQLVGTNSDEELEVMFVVVKNEIVQQVTLGIEYAGIKVGIVDVAPCACYNVARAVQVGQDECTVLLDMGNRSTNLLFIDGNSFFTRTIPIAGHAITQQIAKEFNVSHTEAEELKIRHGFVGLGGAYEEPESEVVAAVSKIIRSVMTRLHGEINRSIVAYRSQQKGRKPTKLLIAGGSTVMDLTDRFFHEKLHVNVEYFNPFQIVEIDAGVDMKRLENVGFSFSQPIGVALRGVGNCPVEINLTPERILKQDAIEKKKPYVYVALLFVLLALSAFLWEHFEKEARYKKLYELRSEDVRELQSKNRKIKKNIEVTERNVLKYAKIKRLLKRRGAWLNVIREVEQARPDALSLTDINMVFATKEADQSKKKKPPRKKRQTFFGPSRRQPEQKVEKSDADGQQKVYSMILSGWSLPMRHAPENENENNTNTAIQAEVFAGKLDESDSFRKTEIVEYSLYDNQKVDQLQLFKIQVYLKDPLVLGYEHLVY